MRLLSTILSGLLSFSLYAEPFNAVPNTFTIKQLPCYGEQCLEINNTNTHERMGTLIPNSNHNGTYIFHDAQGQVKIIFQHIYTSLFSGYYFNVYDQQGRFLSKIASKMNPLVDTQGGLSILDLDAETFKYFFSGNTIGTYHTFIEGKAAWGKTVLADMRRSLRSLDTDSTVTIKQREQLFSLIQPEVFVALSAFYCLNIIFIVYDSQIINLKSLVETLVHTHPIKQRADLPQLQAIANRLDTLFQAQYQNVILSTEERIQKFVEFSCDLVQSHTLDANEEDAAVQYLKNMMSI